MSKKKKQKRRFNSATRKLTRETSRKHKKPKRFPDTLSETHDFRNLLHDLEKCPFFELDPRQKNSVTRLEKIFGSKIEAWSFVLHPDVLNAVQGETQRLTRYIFTVDTLMAKAYFAVQEFLQSQKVNINSYFSGGWADFVCEAHLTEKQFNSLLANIEDILNKAGAAKLVEGENVRELISVFRVKESLILCGKQISKVARPEEAILEEIRADPVKFEVVYRNYRSDEARKYFTNGEKGLRAYVKRLHAGHVILCFRAVFDSSRHFEWDYVPLQRARRLLHPAELGTQQAKLLKPVVDLLEVDPIDAVDKEEAEVTHIFINQYDFPGGRQDWKRLIYKNTDDNVNLYTYPLEGTLNESPIYLSDVPEILERAASYKEGEIFIGTVDDPLIKTAIDVRLPINSFGNHGITLGMPGSGKTNTDMLLLEQASNSIPTVVILDASKSVKGKFDVLKPDVRKRLKQIELAPGATHDELTTAVGVLRQRGLYLIEPERSIFPTVLDLIIKQLEDVPDATTGNQNRVVTGFLLIEEANDAFGTNAEARDERLRNVEMLLNKASRKGWSVWLSTQYPSHLGRDDETRTRILHTLKNRIVHPVGGDDNVNLILKVLESGGATPEDCRYVLQRLKAMNKPEDKGSAIVCGTASGDQGVPLRPIAVKVCKLPANFA